MPKEIIKRDLEAPNKQFVLHCECAMVNGCLGVDNISSALTNPEYIKALATVITSGVAITSTVISGLKLWLDERKSRKIRLRRGDHELELQGYYSNEKISEILETFNEFVRDEDAQRPEVTIVDEHSNEY